MIGNKCFKVLKTLPLEEFKALRKAVQSPIFGGNESLLTLYEYLRKYYPAFDSKKLEGEYIYATLYPGKKYKEGVVRVKFRQLTKLTEDFLIWKQINKDDFQRRKILKDAYGLRNNFELFEKETQNLREELENLPFRDMEYYREKVDLDYAYGFHPLLNKHNIKDTTLESLVQEIDRHALLCKLRVGIALKNKEHIFNKTFDLPFLDALKNKAFESFQLENPLPDLYLSLFEMMATKEEAVFYDLKKLFFGNVKVIRGMDQLVIYFLLLNYCIRKLNKGETKFYKETLDLYKIGLTLKVLIPQDSLSDIAFANIVSAGCHEKEFEWVSQFISQYEMYLNYKFKEDAINYSKGVLFFNQQKYEEALSFLISHNFSKYYQSKVRFLIIKNSFEQFLIDSSFFDLLHAQIEAFEKYILRDEIRAPGKLLPHQNSIKILKSLSEKIIKGEKNKSIKIWFDKKIEDSKILLDRNWFNKIGSLIEKPR